MSKEKKVLELSAKMNFKDILFHIRLNGYGYIGFYYSGSGDSGSIDAMYLVLKDLASQNDDGQILTECSDWELQSKSEHDLPKEIWDMVENHIYTHILDDAPDWYNNDGGGGHGYICTENGDFSVDHYINIVETEEEQLIGNLFD